MKSILIFFHCIKPNFYEENNKKSTSNSRFKNERTRVYIM